MVEWQQRMTAKRGQEWSDFSRDPKLRNYTTAMMNSVHETFDDTHDFLVQSEADRWGISRGTAIPSERVKWKVLGISQKDKKAVFFIKVGSQEIKARAEVQNL